MTVDNVVQKTRILAAWGNQVAASVNSLLAIVGQRGDAFTADFGTTAGTIAAGDDARINGSLQKAQNLADLPNKPTARTNLGLGTAATANIGAGSNEVVSGSDTRLVGALQRTNNLSDLTNIPVARANLGITGGFVPVGGLPGQVLGKLGDDDFETGWVDQTGGGGGAVESVNGKIGAVILTHTDVGAAAANHAATHGSAGSDPVALDAAQISTGIIADARIPAAITRDSELVAAIAAHLSATDPHGDRNFASSLVDDLSGVTNAATARTNLGLGTAATQPVGAFDPAGASTAAYDAARQRSNHTGVQPVSSITGLQYALDQKADLTALTAHISDTIDAHDASAISFAPGAGIAADNVQAAIIDVKNSIGSGGGGGGAVDSVNGETGIVTLDAADVGADPVGSASAAQAFAIQRANHTGTQSADTLTDGTTNKAFLASERTKLAGISAGATVNSSDATLLNRSFHTGTQSSDTLTDGTTSKSFLATERTKLAGISAGATVNDTDANLKNRANHTGTQAISTVTGLQTALDGKQPFDQDLTDLAAATITAYGRNLLSIPDQATLTAAIALATTALAGIAELATSAETVTGTDPNRVTTPQGVKAAIDAYAATVTTALAGKQPIDTTLTAFSNLLGAPDKGVMTTANDVFATYDLTSLGRSLVAGSTTTAMRSTLGLGALATQSTIDYSTAAPDSVFAVKQNSDGSWPARPSARTDLCFFWIGYPGRTEMPSGYLPDYDFHFFRATAP